MSRSTSAPSRQTIFAVIAMGRCHEGSAIGRRTLCPVPTTWCKDERLAAPSVGTEASVTLGEVGVAVGVGAGLAAGDDSAPVRPHPAKANPNAATMASACSRTPTLMRAAYRVDRAL